MARKAMTQKKTQPVAAKKPKETGAILDISGAFLSKIISPESGPSLFE